MRTILAIALVWVLLDVLVMVAWNASKYYYGREGDYDG